MQQLTMEENEGIGLHRIPLGKTAIQNALRRRTPGAVLVRIATPEEGGSTRGQSFKGKAREGIGRGGKEKEQGTHRSDTGTKSGKASARGSRDQKRRPAGKLCGRSQDLEEESMKEGSSYHVFMSVR